MLPIEKISGPVRRALEAVDRGQVFKKVGRRHSRLEGPIGVGSASLLKCKLARLMEDGPKSGALNVRYQQVLTALGRRTLESGEFDPNPPVDTSDIPEAGEVFFRDAKPRRP